LDGLCPDRRESIRLGSIYAGSIWEHQRGHRVNPQASLARREPDGEVPSRFDGPIALQTDINRAALGEATWEAANGC
jgi:predicted NBD/HSP70 family sugar kinase